LSSENEPTYPSSKRRISKGGGDSTGKSSEAVDDEDDDEEESFVGSKEDDASGFTNSEFMKVDIFKLGNRSIFSLNRSKRCLQIWISEKETMHTFLT
jgi:hypothetical protein